MQDPPKFTQKWDFWFENIPSGSPDTYIRNDRLKLRRRSCKQEDFLPTKKNREFSQQPLTKVIYVTATMFSL
jgi:hypothetical protein